MPMPPRSSLDLAFSLAWITSPHSQLLTFGQFHEDLFHVLPRFCRCFHVRRINGPGVTRTGIRERKLLFGVGDGDNPVFGKVDFVAGDNDGNAWTTVEELLGPGLDFGEGGTVGDIED